jgi:hypothetical protein
MRPGPCAGFHIKETNVHRSQDIGTVRGELVHQALAGEQGAQPGTRSAAARDGNVRELLDEAHARIRHLENAIRRLTAAL